ncbi:DUF3302 domain-containing protein [Rhodobacterales bacterium]|nr:DUF3302 domain-containing protein [Rhodobacterales bacterium]
MGLIDFDLDIYDYATFIVLFLVVVVFFFIMITLGDLPGKLAERRNHPHAESVKLGGWIGLFTVFPGSTPGVRVYQARAAQHCAR